MEKARAVAQRALDTINYREEGEKMNEWEIGGIDETGKIMMEDQD